MAPSEILPVAAYCAAARADSGLPPLVLCTGRQIPYAECIAQLVGAFFPGYPCIVENGAFLYDVVRNDISLNPFVTPEALENLASIRAACDALMARHGAKKEYGKEACISLNPPDGMTVEAFYAIAREALAPWAGSAEITHSKSAVDITPAGIDKAAGIRCLAERTGIPPEEMLGIGDTIGDMPMLRLVGTPTGPANASAEVSGVAAFIAPSAGPLGVAEILRRYTDWA